MVKLVLLCTALPLTQAIRLFLTNNDGWDNSNIRSLFNLLDTTTSHELILCAPEIGETNPLGLFPMPNNGDEEMPEDEWSTLGDDSSTSGDDRSLFDEDDSLPEDGWSPLNNKDRAQLHHNRWPWGFNVSDFRLNFVPFGPFNTISEGLTLLPSWLYRPRDGVPAESPDLFVVGPKIGSSLGDDWRSDPAIAAVQMFAEQKLLPSIFFAGATGVRVRSDRPQPLWSKIYAELAEKIISAIVRGGAPYLPKHTHLHVNFPHVTDECNDASKFKFVLTRHSRVPDNRHMLNRLLLKKLPFETDVVNKDGCYVAMSLVTVQGQAYERSGLSVTAQRQIIKKLEPLVSPKDLSR